MRALQFQFGTGRLIALTTVVAVIMAITMRLNAPHVAQIVLGAYFTFFASWIVMRGPSIYANWFELRKRRQEIKDRRRKLEGEASELRRTNDRP